MKQSRLRDQHLKQGALFGEVAGWEMPARYGDPAVEYAVVRKGVGITDLSHRGKLRVTGEDRVKWLQSVISNDILPLTAGHGLYSSLLTHKGKMLSYFRVYALPESLLLEDVGEIGDTTFQALRKFLLYGTKAKMDNCAESWGLLMVSGPKAPDLIKSAFGTDVSRLPPLAFIAQSIPLTPTLSPGGRGEGEGGQQALLIRTEETGETDIEILIPADGLVPAWERLWEVGTPMGLKPFGTEARETLRLEAGLPRAGADLNEEIVPPEANLEGKAFSLTKGCYPGQEVVARMDTYGSVRRRLVGLVLKDPVLPPKGAKLFSGEREVGWISSAVRSPSLGSVIAFGFPLRDFSSPGTMLAVDIAGTRHDATVHPLPFYSAKTPC
ncbi:MAG: aminomethyl transferase family protein [Nitrospirae bacterium]|nr:aminomethyl transferase family protein [Nitrospirota bacterium]